MSNSSHPDQARRFVGPNLDPNCLQILSAGDTSRQIINRKSRQKFSNVLPLVPGWIVPHWILVLSDPWRWQEKLLCSIVWHYHQSYVQHYMANLMLVQWVIAIHAEVWTCHFGGNSIYCQWPWYRSQKVLQCLLNVNIMANIKKVMLTKDAPLSSHLAVTFCKLDNFFLTSQASKINHLVAFYGVVKDRFSTKSESMKSATALLPISSASIRSLAMPDL